MAKWYLVKDAKADGPHSTEEILSMASQGKVNLADLGFKVGGAEWKPLESFSEFKSQEGLPTSSAVLPPVDESWVLLKRTLHGSASKFDQKGPFSKDQVLRQLKENQIQMTDYAWKQGFTSWVKLKDLNEFVVDSHVEEAPLMPLTEEDEVTVKKLLKDIMSGDGDSQKMEATVIQTRKESREPQKIDFAPAAGDSDFERTRVAATEAAPKIHGQMVRVHQEETENYEATRIAPLKESLAANEKPAPMKPLDDENTGEFIPPMTDFEESAPPERVSMGSRLSSYVQRFKSAEPWSRRKKILAGTAAVVIVGGFLGLSLIEGTPQGPRDQVAKQAAPHIPPAQAPVQEPQAPPPLPPQPEVVAQAPKLEAPPPAAVQLPPPPPNLKPLEVEYSNGGGDQIIVRHNEVPGPLDLKVVGRSGQILSLPSFEKREKVNLVPGQPAIVSMSDWNLPEGTYEVVARAGKFRESISFFKGVKDENFMRAISLHRKKISARQQQELLSIRWAAQQYVKLVKDLSQQSAAKQKNSKAQKQFMSQWNSRFMKLNRKVSEFRDSSGYSKLAYPHLQREMEKSISELSQQLKVTEPKGSRAMASTSKKLEARFEKIRTETLKQARPL